jgi:hypothetical protein
MTGQGVNSNKAAQLNILKDLMNRVDVEYCFHARNLRFVDKLYGFFLPIWYYCYGNGFMKCSRQQKDGGGISDADNKTVRRANNYRA